MPRAAASDDPLMRWTTIGVPVRVYQKEALERYAREAAGIEKVGTWARSVILASAPPIPAPSPLERRREPVGA
jgi:hypothetical protein